MAKSKHKFNDHPFAYHQEIELEIATLTNLGAGLGRIDGWVVFVPFALPGEKVRARVFRNQKNFSEADLVEVLERSPDRVEPKCPIFGICGGCQYQNLAYPAQLQWKQRQVGELLKHMAGIEFPVNPVIGSPREYAYRSKITPHFQKPQTQNPNDEGRRPNSPHEHSSFGIRHSGFAAAPIGFLQQGKRFELVDVPRCEIATDAINSALPAARTRVVDAMAAGQLKQGGTILLRDAGGKVTTDYEAVIEETIQVAPSVSEALRLRFRARDFFQNNPFILPEFVRYVTTQAAAGGARYLVDAYCGSGLFALAAAARFEKVAGVEVTESSVAFARENAASNKIANATFVTGDASAIFSGLTFPPTETAIVIDPPRKGCDEGFLHQLFAFGPATVVYVSCDPATQIRDLRLFTEAGYKLLSVQPFDLFPQTRHLECVTTLNK